MKTNHDGTITLNADTWTSCNSCSQRVTGDSIHTCSPQLRELSDEEIIEIASPMFVDVRYPSTALEFARAILKKARGK